jgi:hypothetical protein
MTKKIGIREVTRNFSILDEYDYVEIEDKKTHKVKGIFVSEKYLDDVREFLEDKKTKEIQEQLDEMSQFIGSMEREDRYKGLEGKALLKEVAKAKGGL